MELILNLGWALVAVWMLCAWVRMAPCSSPNRRTQMVALAVVILILLPAISMTDDLLAAQNPAELDSSAYSVRRHHDSPSPHSNLPAVTALPSPAFAGLSLNFVRMAAPGDLPFPLVDNPALAPIQNRPPPVA